MISQIALQKILGIDEKVHLKAEEMADKLNITFFPYISVETPQRLIDFAEKLKRTLIELKVNVVPYESSLERIPLRKRCRRLISITFNNISYIFYKYILQKQPPNIYINSRVVKNLLKSRRVKKGVSVVAVGEGEVGNLPMDSTSSFRESSVVTILELPNNINEQTDFYTHFDTALSLFAYHMTNIVIGVGEKRWILYNFNASHPIYDLDTDFKEHVLQELIPKIAAPIRAHRFSEFVIQEEAFNVKDHSYKSFISDIVQGSSIFDKTGLYPQGKRIEELNFRNNYYRWIGRIHLDNRNGMSYGFMARQLPVILSKPITLDEALQKYAGSLSAERDWFIHNDQLFILFEISQGRFCMQIPEVWVLSQRSGSDKTHFNPQSDLIKLGLKNGIMYLQTPQGTKLNQQYKPSFDTKVILAHAVGNAIIASIINHFSPSSVFVKTITKKGYALSHWHGYFDPGRLPNRMFIHGVHNPHVACSSPQSALYAIQGKLEVFLSRSMSSLEYFGDAHVEPHHGTNVSFPTLRGLASYLKNVPEASVLGNRYLSLYYS